ncbi:hypothetical protein [Enterococcus hulanensis]|uniref:hypothetical protein n=1 Tax=Enterococcus hulanensis TaxID=2559929 RepID=UPI000B756D57|nr:hypothetical protein [Enterococcus hulanensis]OTO14656.1 hypothetical protein A5875_003813 [Enterococcus sp. 3H8_DIV0648]
MRKMKYVVLIIATSLSFCIPAFASDQTSSINIRISEADNNKTPESFIQKEKPMNVLPLTSGRDIVASSSRKRLPQTGDQTGMGLLESLGMLCLVIYFWLYVFFRLRLEDEND